MGKNEPEAKQWFAIRVTYSREMALKEYLDRCRMESFIPMSYKEVIKGERKVRKLVPVIHNLVLDRETRRPLVVPDRQMHSFIAVAGAYDEQIVYLDPTIVSLREGDRVRIVGGVFSGVEGIFIRIKGDRRVVVSIEGVMAVATAFVHPSLIEPVLQK